MGELIFFLLNLYLFKITLFDPNNGDARAVFTLSDRNSGDAILDILNDQAHFALTLRDATPEEQAALKKPVRYKIWREIESSVPTV